MAFDQILTSTSVISSGLKGYQAVSLTNFTTSAESLIASGSAVEVANAFFLADANITPQASTWTSISTGATAYITLTPSGTAGTQVLTAKYSSTAPEWSTSKQGWYLTAGSTIRYVVSVYKSGTSKYDNAFVVSPWQSALPAAQSLRAPDRFTESATAQSVMAMKVLNIGDWNMDTTTTVTVTLGITHADIRAIQVTIRGDTAIDEGIQDIRGDGEDGYWQKTGITNLNLHRTVGGLFDSANFDATSYNRGWVTVWYVT